MTKTFIGVREVDEEVFRQFRAMTVRRRIKLGEAITKAMENLLEEQKIKEKKKKRLHYLDEVKPLSFGNGTENTSEEIDKIVYGV